MKILIVDDDHGMRESMASLLTIMEHEPVEAADCVEADAYLENETPDLVITDHNLGTGKEKGANFAIRVKQKGIPVCVCSGDWEAGEQIKDEDIPFFLKPTLVITIIKEMGLS